jgi:hypothetical protein
MRGLRTQGYGVAAANTKFKANQSVASGGLRYLTLRSIGMGSMALPLKERTAMLGSSGIFPCLPLPLTRPFGKVAAMTELRSYLRPRRTWPRGPAFSFRPCLEALEDRTLPSLFSAAVNFPTGMGPALVAVADVNGDGKPDLVAASWGSNSVSVLLGNGNGTFQAAKNFGVGIGPESVAVADVNGDGRPDRVVANEVSAPASATAGTPFIITVTALTAGNQLDAVYTGTVHFTSSDGAAVLPANYTFTLADTGSHTFSVTLNTDGNMTITATDKHPSSITGKAVVAVNGPAPPHRGRGPHRGGSAPVPAAAATDSGSTATANATAGPAFALTVKALEVFGTAVPGYPGTVAFGSLDGAALLRGYYTFVSTEDATHTFTVTDTVPATVPTGGRVPGGRDPFDPDGEVLNPAGVEAFFAQDLSRRRDDLGTGS